MCNNYFYHIVISVPLPPEVIVENDTKILFENETFARMLVNITIRIPELPVPRQISIACKSLVRGHACNSNRTTTIPADEGKFHFNPIIKRVQSLRWLYAH
jgi:hypothetical protein